MTPASFFPLIALDNGSSQRNHLKEERGARPKGAHDMAKQFGNYLEKFSLSDGQLAFKDWTGAWLVVHFQGGTAYRYDGKPLSERNWAREESKKEVRRRGHFQCFLTETTCKARKGRYSANAI